MSGALIEVCALGRSFFFFYTEYTCLEERLDLKGIIQYSHIYLSQSLVDQDLEPPRKSTAKCINGVREQKWGSIFD